MDITHWSATLKDKSRITSPNLLGEESYHTSSKVSGTWLAQSIRSIFWLIGITLPNQNIYKITMVPQNGIEPLIADYKAAVMPFNYKGVSWRGWFYLGQILEPLLVFAFAVCFHG